MGFDDVLDLNLNMADSDLEKLDKQAAKAEKILEKAQKNLSQRGQFGIFAGVRGNIPANAKINNPERFRGLIGTVGGPLDLRKKTLVDEIKEQRGVLEQILEGDLGSGKAGVALRLLTNPAQTIEGFVTKILPILAGVSAFVGIVEEAVTFLTGPGMPLDVHFKNMINNLVDAFRDKQTRASIAAGYTQEIITSKAGTFNPRNAYNTYVDYNRNRQQLESDFKARYSWSSTR